MQEVLLNYSLYIIVAHVLCVAIGLGGATITDVLFFKFLRDLKISNFESRVMNLLSAVIWTALGGIVFTGLLILLGNPEYYLASSKFLAKMSIVGVLIVNGVVLNVFISPKITKIFSGKGQGSVEIKSFRKWAFACGAVSMVSWYSAFLLGSLQGLNLTYDILILIYGLLLCGALVGSQLAEKVFVRRGGVTVYAKISAELQKKLVFLVFLVLVNKIIYFHWFCDWFCVVLTGFVVFAIKHRIKEICRYRITRTRWLATRVATFPCTLTLKLWTKTHWRAD